VILRLLDWLCARWLRRYEGDLPVVTRATVIPTATVVPFKPTQERIHSVDTPLADALAKPIVLPDVPKQTVTVKGEWDQSTKDVGVALEADLDIGRPGGWTTGATAQWWKDRGAKAIGWLQWKGK
jgi:hypothetical protein